MEQLIRIINTYVILWRGIGEKWKIRKGVSNLRNLTHPFELRPKEP